LKNCKPEQELIYQTKSQQDGTTTLDGIELRNHYILSEQVEKVSQVCILKNDSFPMFDEEVIYETPKNLFKKQYILLLDHTMNRLKVQK
jgi:hypothetical protein